MGLFSHDIRICLRTSKAVEVPFFVAPRRDKRSTTPGRLVFGLRRANSHRVAGVKVQGQNLAYARLSDWCERRISRQRERLDAATVAVEKIGSLSSRVSKIRTSSRVECCVCAHSLFVFFLQPVTVRGLQGKSVDLAELPDFL